MGITHSRSTLERLAQELRRGIPHRAEHRVGRNRQPFKTFEELDGSETCSHSNKDDAFVQQGSCRAVGLLTHYGTVELSGATVTQPTGGSNLGRMYSSAEAIAIRAAHIEGNRRDDKGDVPS